MAGTYQPAPLPQRIVTEVVVRDIDMPFSSMIMFMVKWAIASIPAFIILVLLGFFAAAVLAGVFRGMVH